MARLILKTLFVCSNCLEHMKQSVGETLPEFCPYCNVTFETGSVGDNGVVNAQGHIGFDDIHNQIKIINGNGINNKKN